MICADAAIAVATAEKYAEARQRPYQIVAIGGELHVLPDGPLGNGAMFIERITVATDHGI